MHRAIIKRHGVRGAMIGLAFGLMLIIQFIVTDTASAAIPSNPKALAPGGNTVDPTPAYTWNKSAAATKYDIQIFDAPGNRIYQRIPAAVVCSVSTCQHTPSKVLLKGAYKWRVRARNSAGQSDWTWYKTFTVVGPPKPVPQAPRGTVSVSQPTYSWTAVEGATEYVLKAYDSQGTRVFLRIPSASSVCAGSTCATTVGKALDVGSYAWQVMGQHQGGSGTWSASTGFSVTGPPAPVSVFPQSSILDPTPAYTWNASAGATSYDIQVFDAAGARIHQRIPAAVDCSGTTCQHIPDKILANGSYSWRVRAVNSVGASGWSGKDFSVVGPARPNPLAPVGKVTVSQPTYTWNAVEGATEYVLKAFDETGTRLFLRINAASKVCTGSTCSASPAKDLIPGNHTWQVMGQHAGGAGTWSSELAFYAAPASWAANGCAGKYTLGDFNGDGRTDRLCSKDLGVTYVSLSTASGLQEGTPWLPNYIKRPITADFDGDGKTDLASFEASTGEFKLARSTGTEFEPRVSWGVAETSLADEPYLCSSFRARTGTGDFNGDGRTDVYCYQPQGRVMVGLNTGNSFSFSFFSDVPCGEGSERVGAADFDADGLTDFFCLQAGGAFSPRLSTGTAFEEGSFTGLAPGFCEADRLMLTDLNRDGAPDAVCPTNGKVALSTGRSFIHQGAFGGFCHYGNSFPADLDGDGVPEIVCNKYEDYDKENDEFIARQRDVLVRKWNGTRLLQDEIWAKYFCTGNYVMTSGDFDGDGRGDVLCGIHKVGVAGISGQLSDLMVSTKSELGGTTTVAYTPSSAFPNTNAPGVRHLVTAVTVADGQGGSSTTTRSYSGARVDRQERRSLGFEQITMTAPCLAEEDTCPYTVTTFSQELAAAGKPLSVERYSGDGALLGSTTYTYTTNSKDIPRTALLTQTDSWKYGPNDSLHTYATNEYDTYGNRTRIVSWGDAESFGDELETLTSFAYNTTDYIVGLVGQVALRRPGGPLLTEVQYEYDNVDGWQTPPVAGDLTAIKRYLDSINDYVKRTITYYPDGNIRRVTDETRRWVETEYESESGYALFPERTWNALNEETSFYWNVACGTVETAIDPNGLTSTTGYDELCRPVRTDMPLGGWIEHFYLDFGNPVLQRTRVEAPGPPGARGPDWSEGYFDGLGRTYHAERRGPTGQGDILTETSYNARGAVRRATEPFYRGERPRDVSYEYDALDRIVRVMLPGGITTETRYDARSRTQIDPAGKPLTERLDAYGRTIEVERLLDGRPILTKFSYDALGRPESMIDPIGIEWAREYDSLGRLTDEYDPDAGYWSYAYDDAGRLETQIDAMDQVTELSYDTVGRLKKKTNPDGVVLYSYGEMREGYANIGRLTSVTSPSDVLETDFDPLGRLVRQKRTLDGQGYELLKVYDDTSGALSTITYPDGDMVGPLTYDAAGRLASIPNFVTSLIYDAAGRPLTQTNQNTTQTTWSYTADLGLTEAIFTDGAQGPVQHLRYSYDSDGIGLVETVTSAVAVAGWDYTYDDLYRMDSATNHSNPAESQDFVHDAAGRMAYNSRVGTYIYPHPGRPQPHAPEEVAGTSFTYNPNGNLLTGGGRRYAWNTDNLIRQITMGTTTTSFNYDGFGSRLKKTTDAAISLYPFGDDYEITDGEVTKYITVDGLGVIAKRVGVGSETETYWLHNDRLGSIQAVTMAGGRVKLDRTYRPYGETLGEVGNHTESRGWIDQRNDPETGLTYLHARYYDPQVGIFLSPDPIGVAGGMNAYGYAFGDPVNLADRGGLTPLSSPLDGGGGIPGWAWWLAWGLLGDDDDDAEPCPLSNPLCQALDDLGLIIYECGGFPDRCAPPPAPEPPDPIEITVVFIGPEEPPESSGSPRPKGTVTLVDSLIYHGAQISAGFGDSLTWGGTDWLRDRLFEDLLNWETTDAVSTDSVGYHVGEIGAIVHGVASGGAGGLRAAGKKMAGREFSHWIPNRYLKRFDSRFIRKTFGRSLLNGNYVTPARHFRHDPFRYPRGWKMLGDRFPAWLAQLDRTPWVIRGGVGGAVWGEARRRLK